MWQKGIKIADGIKVPNPLTLTWEHYPGEEYAGGRAKQKGQCQLDVPCEWD